MKKNQIKNLKEKYLSKDLIIDYVQDMLNWNLDKKGNECKKEGGNIERNLV